MSRFLTITYKWARRCVIALIGGTVVLIGVVMIVTPGPAFVVIPAGLAILGLEFACARRWLHQLRATGTSVLRWSRLKFWRARPSADERASSWRGDTYAPQSIGPDNVARVRASTKTGYYRVP